MINSLQTKYANYIKPIHINTMFEQVITKFKNNGGITTVGATNPNWDTLVTNGKITAPFVADANYQNMDKYFFFDGIHPNRWGHKQIGKMTYNQVKTW